MFRVLKILLFFALIYYLFTAHQMIIIKSYAAKVSYLKSVETKHISSKGIKVLLKAWGYYGTGVDVVPTEGYRPIIIKEMDTEGFLYKNFGRSVAGLALPTLWGCIIYLNPDIAYRPSGPATTILHEYLHCLGYEHVDNQYDLMYTTSGYATMESIKGYSKAIYRRMR